MDRVGFTREPAGSNSLWGGEFEGNSFPNCSAWGSEVFQKSKGDYPIVLILGWDFEGDRRESCYCFLFSYAVASVLMLSDSIEQYKGSQNKGVCSKTRLVRNVRASEEKQNPFALVGKHKA